MNDGSTIDLEEDISRLKSGIPELLVKSYKVNRGKGYALRTGVKASTSEVIMYTDHDLPYTYGSMEELLQVLDHEDAEIVIAHRGENYYKNIPWIRIKVSHYLKTVNRLLLGLQTDDTQCGLKVFKATVKDVFLATKTDRFLIDIEFLKRLKKANKRIYTIDVKTRDNVQLSPIGFRTILSELWSYVNILLFV